MCLIFSCVHLLDFFCAALVFNILWALLRKWRVFNIYFDIDFLSVRVVQELKWTLHRRYHRFATEYCKELLMLELSKLQFVSHQSWSVCVERQISPPVLIEHYTTKITFRRLTDALHIWIGSVQMYSQCSNTSVFSYTLQVEDVWADYL